MRTLLLTDSDSFAGTERHILALGCGLSKCGVDVRIGCPSPSPLARNSSEIRLPVIQIPKRGFVDFTAIRILRGLLTAGEVDIIHAHNGRTALAAALALQFAGTGRCIRTEHFVAPAHIRRRSLSS